MPTLIASLSTGKGTWSEVNKIIQSYNWTNVYLITNQFGKDTFKPGENTKLITINTEQDPTPMCEQIKKELRGKIMEFEIALNFASGTGKEHMAILEAVMELGCAFRIITINKNEVEIMGLKREE